LVRGHRTHRRVVLGVVGRLVGRGHVAPPAPVRTARLRRTGSRGGPRVRGGAGGRRPGPRQPVRSRPARGRRGPGWRGRGRLDRRGRAARRRSGRMDRVGRAGRGGPVVVSRRPPRPWTPRGALPGRAGTLGRGAGALRRALVAAHLAADLPPPAEHLVHRLGQHVGRRGEHVGVDRVAEHQHECVAVHVAYGRLPHQCGGAFAAPPHHRHDLVPDAAYGGRVEGTGRRVRGGGRPRGWAGVRRGRRIRRLASSGGSRGGGGRWLGGGGRGRSSRSTPYLGRGGRGGRRRGVGDVRPTRRGAQPAL